METPPSDCPGCRLRDEQIAALQAEVAALNHKVDELMRRLPPPPTRPQERYPKAPAKKPSKNKRGARKGHPPQLKRMAPPERVNHTFVFAPTHCAGCQQPLPDEPGPNDPPPTRFQVAELPPMAAEITEYQGQARVCPCCQTTTREAIPAELCRHSVGPNYTATLAYLAGAHGMSKRGLEELCDAIFDAPVALGTIANLEQEMSAALADAHEQAVQAVRAAEAKHLDETGWKQNGKKRWLWVAASQTAVVFLIHRLRNTAPLIRLLGQTLVGILCSDRWHAYNYYSIDQRQVCWAHVKRNFAKLAERSGVAKEIGTSALAVQRRVFDQWHLFRGGGISRAELIDRIDPLEKALIRILSRGAHSGDKKTARFCKRLYGVQDALWTFARVEGIDPTNNHAERVQRLAVLWRRKSFGCQSEAGCRFVERILTVVQTLRLQKRSVLDFLKQAIAAKRNDQPGPALV